MARPRPAPLPLLALLGALARARAAPSCSETLQSIENIWTQKGAETQLQEVLETYSRQTLEHVTELNRDLKLLQNETKPPEEGVETLAKRIVEAANKLPPKPQDSDYTTAAQSFTFAKALYSKIFKSANTAAVKTATSARLQKKINGLCVAIKNSDAYKEATKRWDDWAQAETERNRIKAEIESANDEFKKCSTDIKARIELAGELKFKFDAFNEMRRKFEDEKKALDSVVSEINTRADESKLQQAELQNLDDRLATLGNDADKARQELEDAARAQKEFTEELQLAEKVLLDTNEMLKTAHWTLHGLLQLRKHVEETLIEVNDLEQKHVVNPLQLLSLEQELVSPPPADLKLVTQFLTDIERICNASTQADASDPLKLACEGAPKRARAEEQLEMAFGEARKPVLEALQKLHALAQPLDETKDGKHLKYYGAVMERFSSSNYSHGFLSGWTYDRYQELLRLVNKSISETAAQAQEMAQTLEDLKRQEESVNGELREAINALEELVAATTSTQGKQQEAANILKDMLQMIETAEEKRKRHAKEHSDLQDQWNQAQSEVHSFQKVMVQTRNDLLRQLND